MTMGDQQPAWIESIDEADAKETYDLLKQMEQQ